MRRDSLSEEVVTDEDEGRIDITSGRSLRFVRWRQVGLPQGIVAAMMRICMICPNCRVKPSTSVPGRQGQTFTYLDG